MNHCPGTDKTIGYAQTGKWVDGKLDSESSTYKPVLVITNISNTDTVVAEILKFLKKHKPCVINIAGNRESNSGLKDFCGIVRKIVYKALQDYVNKQE